MVLPDDLAGASGSGGLSCSYLPGEALFLLEG